MVGQKSVGTVAANPADEGQQGPTGDRKSNFEPDAAASRGRELCRTINGLAGSRCVRVTEV